MTVIAYGAYDNNAILEHLAEDGALAVISSESNGTELRIRNPAVRATRSPLESRSPTAEDRVALARSDEPDSQDSISEPRDLLSLLSIAGGDQEIVVRAPSE